MKKKVGLRILGSVAAAAVMLSGCQSASASGNIQTNEARISDSSAGAEGEK